MLSPEAADTLACKRNRTCAAAWRTSDGGGGGGVATGAALAKDCMAIIGGAGAADAGAPPDGSSSAWARPRITAPASTLGVRRFGTSTGASGRPVNTASYRG
jgi:hypothetical protein